MKVLFDCIVTQNPASKCSTTVQFITLAKLLLQKQNTFIYWPIPEWADENDFPQSDCIKYWKVQQYRDRMREYNRIPVQLENLLSFTGESWDWDVLVTVRTLQVAMMRVMSVSPRQRNRRDWSKRIVLIEDMMILSKKPTIAMSNEDVQDRLSIEGYLAADKVLLPSYHEKIWLLDVAKRHFSIARLKELNEKVKQVCQLDMSKFQLKTEYKYHKDRKLNVAFVGRLEKTNARLEIINELMKNQYILHSDSIRTMILTVSSQKSPGERKLDKDAIEILHPNREEFHNLAEKELDLGVFFHVDVGLNMSMLEPISLGVPEIVKRDLWSVGMFGDEYPFYVDNEMQAYAMILKFVKDYDVMYAEFTKWFQNWFLPVFSKRMMEDGLYVNLIRFINESIDLESLVSLDGMRFNNIVSLLVKYGGKNFELLDVIKKLEGTEIKSLAVKVNESFDKRGLVWGTPWNEFRLALKMFFGYEDASVKLGHLYQEG